MIKKRIFKLSLLLLLFIFIGTFKNAPTPKITPPVATTTITPIHTQTTHTETPFTPKKYDTPTLPKDINQRIRKNFYESKLTDKKTSDIDAAQYGGEIEASVKEFGDLNGNKFIDIMGASNTSPPKWGDKVNGK